MNRFHRKPLIQDCAVLQVSTHRPRRPCHTHPREDVLSVFLSMLAEAPCQRPGMKPGEISMQLQPYIFHELGQSIMLEP